MAKQSTSSKHNMIRVAYYVGPRGSFRTTNTDSFQSMYSVWKAAPNWARFAIGETCELDYKFYIWDLDLTQLQANGPVARIPVWRTFTNLDAALAAASLKADDPGPNQLTRLVYVINKTEWIIQHEKNRENTSNRG